MRTIQLFLLATLLVNLTTSTIIITNKKPKLVDLGQGKVGIIINEDQTSRQVIGLLQEYNSKTKILPSVLPPSSLPQKKYAMGLIPESSVKPEGQQEVDWGTLYQQLAKKNAESGRTSKGNTPIAYSSPNVISSNPAANQNEEIDTNVTPKLLSQPSMVGMANPSSTPSLGLINQPSMVGMANPSYTPSLGLINRNSGPSPISSKTLTKSVESSKTILTSNGVNTETRSNQASNISSKIPLLLKTSP